MAKSLTLVLGVTASKPLPNPSNPLKNPPQGVSNEEFAKATPEERAVTWGKWIDTDYKPKKNGVKQGQAGVFSGDFENRLWNMIARLEEINHELAQKGARASVFIHAEIICAIIDHFGETILKKTFRGGCFVPESHGFRHKAPPDGPQMETTTKYAIGATLDTLTQDQYIREITEAQAIIAAKLGIPLGTGGAPRVLLASLGNRHIDELTNGRVYLDSLAGMGITGVLSKFRPSDQPEPIMPAEGQPKFFQTHPNMVRFCTVGGLDVWQLSTITRLILTKGAGDTVKTPEQTLRDYIAFLSQAKESAGDGQIYLPMLFHSWIQDHGIFLIKGVLDFCASNGIRVSDYRGVVEEMRDK